jgi:hypothetical protein
MGNPRARAIVEFLCPRNKDLVDENGPGGTTVMPVVFCEEHAREFCDQLRDAGLVVELETTPRNALRQ